MTMWERMTGAGLLALVGVTAWFVWQVMGDGLGRTPPATVMTAALAIVVLTSLFAALATATQGGGRRVDERDVRVAGWSQAIRGYLYLGTVLAVLAVALLTDQRLLANLLFLAVLASEIASAAIMLALYRRSA